MFLTMRDTCPLKTILIDASEERRVLFAEMLQDRDFQIVGAYPDLATATEAKATAELVMFHGGDGTVTEEITRLSVLGGAVMILVDHADCSTVARLVRAGADQVVPLGGQTDRIAFAAASAVATRKRGEEERMARWRAEAQLIEHRLVQRAKSILMDRHGLDEPLAHRKVQTMSMERNLPMGDMARAIIEAENLLC